MVRYPKLYTVKEWKKFSLEMQERLCKRYEVILTDHKTRNEKLKAISAKFTIKNLNRGIDSFNRGVDSFSKSMDGFSKEMGKLEGELKKDRKDYSALVGKKTKRDYSALTG